MSEKLTWEQWLEEFNRWMTFRHGETSRQADAMILFGQAKSPMAAADLLGATLERVDQRTF